MPARLPPVAVTMGDPAGIGGELTLKAWLARRRQGPAFFAIDNGQRLAGLAKKLGWAVPLAPIGAPGQANEVFANALPVIDVALAQPSIPGRINAKNGAAVLASIDMAVGLARSGAAAAVLTNPINKAALYAAGFTFPGHTEYLEHLCGGHSVMMLASPALRVVPVTIHQSLRAAIASLSTDKIVACGRIAADALRGDFGIAAPRLAVAGLNPHAGEQGSLGEEDQAIVAPAVAQLRALGLAVQGPLAADSMFHEAARAQYDAALCMYHDQALIPLKTLDFFAGVNVTLGLPIVRTSPDHGTAFDLAGTGKADPTSLVEALKLAARLSTRQPALADAK